MADEKSALQTILENLRNAAVHFAGPFQNNAVRAVRDLLKELGIVDPPAALDMRLDQLATRWKQIAQQLQSLQFDFTRPEEAINGLVDRAKLVQGGFKDLVNAPGALWNDLGVANVATVFPERLVGYILYEFVIATHPKIAGVFLILGVIRREWHDAAPGLVRAQVRVFDFEQFIGAVTHPKESFKKALLWGQDGFNARPIVDGFALLGDLVQAGEQIGPKDDTFPLADENDFVNVAGGVAPSARRTLTVNTPLGPQLLSFVGLHRHGVGVLVQNPIQATGGVGSMTLDIPRDAIFALTPDGSPDADPKVAVFNS